MSAEWSTSVSSTSNERRSSNPFWRSMMALILGLMACPFTGCLSAPGRSASDRLLPQLIDVQVEAYRDKVWARRAYNLRYGNVEQPYGNHFRRGFIDGYCDVCQGNSGYVPAMPPDSYWGNEYKSAEGAKCVNAWFEGFPAGAEAAKKGAAGKYRNIYISKMINSAITQEKQQEQLPVQSPTSAEAPPLIPAATPQPQPSFLPNQNSVPSTKNSSAALPMIIKPAQYSEPTDY